MDKLIKKLKQWHFSETEPIHLSKWTRQLMFEFITKEIKKAVNNDKWRDKYK